jgi:hypothetical protein
MKTTVAFIKSNDSNILIIDNSTYPLDADKRVWSSLLNALLIKYTRVDYVFMYSPQHNKMQPANENSRIFLLPSLDIKKLNWEEIEY